MRSKMILMLAIIMGGITTLLFYIHLQKYETQAATNESFVDIVIAAEPLKKNERITAKKLKLVSVPQMTVHAQSISSISEVDGLIVNADIEAGEPILQHRIERQGEENLFLSKKIKEGHRAVSVGVDFVQSVSTLIEPEDYVDIIFSERFVLDGKEQVKTTVLLKNVRVLAVGRKLLEPTSSESYVEYNSVTLEILPEHTVSIVNASERGNIQLSLNSRISN